MFYCSQIQGNRAWSKQYRSHHKIPTWRSPSMSNALKIQDHFNMSYYVHVQSLIFQYIKLVIGFLFKNTENQTAELYQKLLKLEQETELLRDINRALREENVLLKDKLKECLTEDHQSKYLKPLHIKRQLCTHVLSMKHN